MKPVGVRWVGKFATVLALSSLLLVSNLVPLTTKRWQSQTRTVDFNNDSLVVDSADIDNSVRVESFRADEIPRFAFEIDKVTVIRKNFGPQISFAAEPDISASVYRNGIITDIQAQVFRTTNNKYEITVDKPPNFQPGKYSLDIYSISDNRQYASRDFTWGVLAINTDKSIYQPGDSVMLALVVLDDKGNMDCRADLELSIKNLDSGSNDLFSTADGTIRLNPECNLKGFTMLPDYEAVYEATAVGLYQVELTAETQNGIRTIIDKFEVSERANFDIKRSAPTRIYPPETYPMTLTIRADTDFIGQIVEKVPDTFQITNPHTISENNFRIQDLPGKSAKLLVWDVNFYAGKSYKLSYTFEAPPVSPELYQLGPLVLLAGEQTVFTEIRSWQIAADDSQGPQFAGSCASDAGPPQGTKPWLNAGNATANDGNNASLEAKIKNGQTTEFLKCDMTGNQFSIPSGATIDGIEVTIEVQDTQLGGGQDLDIRILKGGARDGTNQDRGTTAWPTTLSTITWGSPTNDWGPTGGWTAADINAADFGVSIRAESPNNVFFQPSIDYVQITVYYTDVIPENWVILLLFSPVLWIGLRKFKRQTTVHI